MMNVYRVITERIDSEVYKDGVRTVQDIKQVNTYYVARNIDKVWDAIELDRIDEGIEVIAIVKESPIVQIIED